VKRFAFTMALGLSLCGVSAFAESYTGYVSDARCGAKHNDGSAESVACVKSCVKGGKAAVFVVGDKIYKIDDASKVADYLGQKVVVDGSVDGDTVTIKSVEAAKAS
jgi:hypothetical protein